MSSDWYEEEGEDQAKDKDKDNDKKQSQTDPSLSPAMTITLKSPKPFITKYFDYFDSMSGETPILYTPKEKHRHDSIMAQQEFNTTECEVLDQDSLEYID